MKSGQLSDRIGNIDDKLVSQVENAPNFKRQRRNRLARRAAAAAAVLALMAGCFTLGAVGMTREVTVFVEKEQELIKVGNSGISLILPGDWKGKYGYESDGENLTVFHLATRETFKTGGILFWVNCADGRHPFNSVFPGFGFTIAITENSTYQFICPSDLQVDIYAPEATAEYDSLSEGISKIEIAMTSQMLENTTNASNWAQGTVVVSYFEADTVTKTVDFGPERSARIREIIESQDYSLVQGSFPCDLLFMFNGAEYYVSSTTGGIQNASGYPYSAVLSAEDLAEILELIK